MTLNLFDIKERLDAKQRALETGSATPVRFTRNGGNFINGFCYLELLPVEWHSAVSSVFGRFLPVNDLLSLMALLWNDYLLVLGPTRDWRVTLGSKIHSPRPGEDVVVHIERNGTLTFDELIHSLSLLSVANQFSVKIGGFNTLSREMVQSSRAGFVLRRSLPSWYLTSFGSKKVSRSPCPPSGSKTGDSVTVVGSTSVFDMRSTVEYREVETLKEVTERVKIPAVEGTAFIGYCSTCMKCFAPSRKAMSKACKYCDESPRLLRRREATKEQIEQFGLVVSNARPVSFKSVTRIVKQIDLVPMPSAVKEVVDLPLLPLRLCKPHVPRPFLSDHEKVKHGINSLGKWSGLLHRLRTKGQLLTFNKKERRIPKDTKLVLPVLNFSNKYSVLDDETLSSDGHVSWFEGFTPLRKPRVRRGVNQRYIDWCDRNLARKKLLANSRGFIRSSGRGVLTFPSGIDGAKGVIRDLCFAGFVGSYSGFVSLARHLARVYNCPSSPLSLCYHDGYARVLEGGFGNGLSIIGCKGLIGHLGEDEHDTPRSPTQDLTSRLEEFRRMSGSSGALSERSFQSLWAFDVQNEHIARHQILIDRIEQPVKLKGLSTEQVMDLVRGLTPCGPEEMTSTILFMVAFRFKEVYGCPEGLHHVNFNRVKRRLESTRANKIELGSGLQFYLDNKPLYHCGSDNKEPSCYRFQSLIWKSLAKKNYLEAANAGVALGKKGVSIAGTGLICEQPNFFHKLTNGFTVSVFAWKARIYSRGFDFSRKDDRPGQDGLITVRQSKLFWNTNGKQLFFTLKGVAKIFFRKGSDEKWRYALAKTVGMSLEAAYDYFSKIVNDEGIPDVTLEENESILPSFMGGVATVTKHVYIETGGKGGHDKEVKTIIPPPPPMPNKVPQDRVNIEMANGDDWLTKKGLEGKSNRSVFRHAFEDWQYRVSNEALKAMNQDLADEPGYRKAFNESSLVVNPKDNFDIKLLKKKPTHIRGPSVPTAAERLFNDIKRLKTHGAGVKTESNVFVDPREKILKEKEKEFGFVTGRVVPPSTHVDGRDSTSADIETNPGPRSDGLTEMHPTPFEIYQLPQIKKKHRREASDLVKKRISIVFTKEGSPLDERFCVMGATPIDSLTEPYEFLRSRDSSDEDIEENPGPVSRGRSSISDENNRLLNEMPMGVAEPRNRSRSRQAVDRIKQAFNIKVDTPLGDVRTQMGFDDGFDLMVVMKQHDSWLNKSYSHHFVIGHLPRDKEWKFYKPNYMECFELNTCQRSLDSLYFAKDRFSLSKVKQLTEIINKFCVMTPLNEGMDFRSISALAHLVKTSLACPTDGNSYAIEMPSEGREIVLHITSEPTPDLINKLVWCIGDSKLFHGGSTRSVGRISNPISIETHDAKTRNHMTIADKDSYEIVGSTMNLWGPIELESGFTSFVSARPFQIAIDSIDKQTDWSDVFDPVFSERLVRYYSEAMPQGRLSLPTFAALVMRIKTIYGCPSESEYVIDLSTTGFLGIYHRPSTVARVVFSVDWSPYYHGGEPEIDYYDENLRIIPSGKGLRIRQNFLLAWEMANDEIKKDQIECSPDQSCVMRDCYGTFAGQPTLRPSLCAAHKEHFYEFKDASFRACNPGIVWFYFLWYHFFSLLYSTWVSFLRPDVSRQPETDPDVDNSECLLVGLYGTRGDIVPVQYFTNVARYYGVPVREITYNHMKEVDLEHLRKGNLLRFLPFQTWMSVAPKQGYKRTFIPHIETSPSVGHTYCLNPPPRYVNDTKFVDDWKKVDLINLLPAIAATLTVSAVSHTWRIGSLKGCDLPRSVDGHTTLKKSQNTGKFEEGWTSGSADEKVIPLSIRKRCPRIPSGDHAKIFRDYKIIHCHGGAGTVQTAVACGARPVVHDPTLDRDYHTLPTQKDFNAPAISSWLGWLVWSGFKLDAPMLIKFYWVACYFWHIKWSFCYDLAYNCAKIYAMVICLRKHWVNLLIVLFVVPTLFWRVVHKSKSLWYLTKMVFAAFWNFPLLCLVQTSFKAVICAWLVSKAVSKGMVDYANSVCDKTRMVFEPVKRGNVTFPFPFGHWSIYDVENNDVIEGHFTTRKQLLGSPFKFRVIKRNFKEGHRFFPAPFNMYKVRKMVNSIDNVEKPYSGWHNCSTFLTLLLPQESFVWFCFSVVVTTMIWVALSPPDFLRMVMNRLYPNHDLDKNPLYLKLGFAAGIENIPFELEDEEMIPFPEEKAEEPVKIDFNDEKSYESLVNELSVISNAVREFQPVTLEDDDLVEAMSMTFGNEIDKIPIPEDSMVKVKDIPPYVKHTWAQIVDMIHHSISCVREFILIDTFIAWLKTITVNIVEFVFPILDFLAYFAFKAIQYSEKAFLKIFQSVCHFLDHIWGLEASKRIKTVWGLTGLHRTGLLGVKMKLAASIAYSEYVGRTDFNSDYNDFVQRAKEYGRQVGATHTKKNVGGPQRRPVGYSKPLMSTEAAKLLGFNEDEFVTDETYQSRIDSYLAKGVAQGADGVFLADKRPELIAKSQHRYEPKYAALNSDDRAIAKEIAQAMFDNSPEVFADCDIEPPKSVLNYIKKKYSPGTPFIKPGGFKSRQAIFDAGYDKAMQKKATELLQSGKYPVQMYHAFVKSQVVDIKKCLPVEEGGKDKDVRTVVSQDLFSYFQDQCLQLERNKRINWDTYGAGIGMPLNQSMSSIFSRMADHQKERGGRYVIADATAFDSICKPFLFEVNANLWELGYKDHPSGNGKNIASVIRASYESRQNCWILGITEPEYDALCVSIPNNDLRKKVLGNGNPKLVELDTLLDHQVYEKLKPDERIKYVQNLTPPPGTVIVTSDKVLRPKRSNWMGKFEMTSQFELASAHEKFFEEHTMQYSENEFDKLYQDIENIANSDFKLLSNVHPKNRGGSTGGSDTSNVNTHAFKAGVIYAWMKTTGRPAADFYKYNMLCNTSDDTIWQTGGKHGLLTVKDVERFKENCAEVGINLEIDTTKDINKVEYLSTLVRTPSKEDSETIRAWRQCKIEAINRSFKAKGQEPPKDLSRFNNPRFLTYKNSKAVLLRRTDFRYYQSSYNKWRYVSIERGAGHGLNTAFLPDLYETFALEWCDDVNVLLKEYGIHRKYQVKNGRFNLQEVQQVDPRSGQQALSPRQKAFLMWLKGCMYPSYYRVIDVHMNVAKVDPEQHSKFIKKLEKGWRGWEEIMKEGVDHLFAFTDSIPDEWSKKFQPGITTMYGEQPFYTKNHYIEKFVYLRLLESTPEEQITFADFSLAIQESPYAGGCDPYYFWEQLGNVKFKEKLFAEDALKYQGLTALVSAVYMMTSAAEFVIMKIFMIGILYKLFLWSFIGLNKVYGVTNTLYWHSTARSSKEISRIMPKDPYITSKLFCIFLVDLLPESTGYIMSPVSLVTDCLPPLLESIGKTWWVGSKIKETTTPNMPQENPWSKYADEYVQKLRSSPTKRAYVAAKTGTGKSTMFIGSIFGAKHRQRIRKIWLVEPRKVLRDNTVMPFGIPYQILKAGIKRSESTDVYMLTYGHFQNRQYDIDPETDIVLFDEFHEKSGHMIMGLDTYKGPIFLLSATPAELPTLKGTPFLVPSIDRRFPVTIYKLPDSMSPVDMFMKARNLYPEQAKRALIVVPTKRMVKMVINQLDYLKVGKASPLTSTEREVANDGIIVSTSIVDAGFDLKPGARLLINWGRTVNIHKGKFMVGKDKEHFPFTSSDVNKQRQGRVGRLEEGIVFECDSAGTGDEVVTYPSPTLFQNKAVSDFFKVPQLTPISGAVTNSLPFLRVNENKLVNLQIQKSVCLVHALSLSDINQQDWERFYTRKLQGHELGEDYEFVDKVCSDRKWNHTPLLSWELAVYHTHRREVVQYSIDNQKKWLLPIKPIDGQWQEIETSMSHNLTIRKITEDDMKSNYKQFAESFDKFKQTLISKSKSMDSELFAKTVASMA